MFILATFVFLLYGGLYLNKKYVDIWDRAGKERAASEAADLLYHAMVLMNVQNVKLEDVEKVLRSRFGVSGVEEKASRNKK